MTRKRVGFEAIYTGVKRQFGTSNTPHTRVLLLAVIDASTRITYRNHIWLPIKHFEGIEPMSRIRFSAIKRPYKGRKRGLVKIDKVRVAEPKAERAHVGSVVTT